MTSDTDLWISIKNGNESAFTTLFYRYSTKIYGKAYYYIKDKEVCEQIVHDIFLTIWKNRKTLEINSFLNYLTSASRYQVYKYLINQKNSPIDYKENLESNYVDTVENTGYSGFIIKDLETELYSHLQNLPKRCREIFIMSRIQSLSNEEIANKLGISKRSVENQITVALKHLRLLLKDIAIIVFFLTYNINLQNSSLKKTTNYKLSNVLRVTSSK